MANDNYLDIDFNTFIEKQKEILRNSDSFKDFDYEGSNISVLMELLAYQMELNTYYQNQIAKNMFLDTANLYSTAHRIANLIGYNAKGHISAYTTLSLEVSGGYNTGDQLYIPEYSVFRTEDGLEFITTKDYTFTVPTTASSVFKFDIGVKEGQHERQTYQGGSLVDYEIYLPTRNYDHDNNSTNNEETVKVYVNDVQWTRLDNFYENVSGLSDDNNVYSFNFDKYQNYLITFSNARNVPAESDDIIVDLINTSGANGSAGSNTIIEAAAPFITNLTQDTTISLDVVSLTNQESTRGASNPENVTQIKKNGKLNINSQYRCVTKEDFKNYLESRIDVVAANIWGEKEINPKGDTQEYNKIHISVIPDTWKSSTISVATSAWDPTDDVTMDVLLPSSYSSDYKNSLKEYIEPRKIMNSFEIYELPEIIYFYLEIGLTTKRIYNFNNVARDVRNKILYYFDNTQRAFNEEVDFRKIEDFVRDTSITSENNSFSNVAGINTFTFRDIMTSIGIYDYAASRYPKYSYPNFDNYYDNVLRPIQLGLNQFPATTEDGIIINNEG